MRSIAVIELLDDDGAATGTNSIGLILDLLRYPSNPSVGADYLEIATVVPLIRKLRTIQDSPAGTTVSILDSEFEEVARRLRKGPYKVVTVALHDLIRALLQEPVQPAEDTV
jgi:hypothetical protein